jgi:hypothetical protein
MEFTLPSHKTKSGTEFAQCNPFLELNTVADVCNPDDHWILPIPKHDTKLSLLENAFMDMSA